MEPQKIMVVEDSQTQSLSLKRALEKEGWEVRCSSSGEAALEELNSRIFDLIVVDYRLPGIGGDELCRRLQMNLNTRGIPILMLTAEETQAAQLRGLESGADDYVPKSADEGILLLRIRALLRKSRVQSFFLGRGEPPFRQARLLAIDDSPTYLAYLSHELGREGYRVEPAANGAEGIARLSRESFDAALVDLMMPEMDGVEVCRRINSRRLRTDNPIVVLMLTARETKEDMTRGLQAGADDFVGKSSDIAVLKARIGALLRRKFLQEENQKILTELKERELQALRERAQKEAAQAKAALAEKLERTASELSAANKELETFTYSASHDLRAPLRAIAGFSRILMDEHSGRLDAEARRLLSVIRDNTLKMGRLIDELLHFSRLGRGELSSSEIPMRGLVESVWEELLAQESRRPALRLEELPQAWGDPGMIRQALVNLLSNALKFTRKKEKAAVEVGGKAQDGENVYHVKDNGAGFDMKYADKLFGVFQRLHGEEEFEGTGVGLAIVQRVILRHGGRVWAEGKVGEGASFYFTLPAGRGVP